MFTYTCEHRIVCAKVGKKLGLWLVGLGLGLELRLVAGLG